MAKNDASEPQQITGYLIPRAVFVPAALGIFALSLVWLNSPLWLLSLPFIYLGSICAAPNLNLADGFWLYWQSVSESPSGNSTKSLARSS